MNEKIRGGELCLQRYELTIKPFFLTHSKKQNLWVHFFLFLSLLLPVTGVGSVWKCVDSFLFREEWDPNSSVAHLAIVHDLYTFRFDPFRGISRFNSSKDNWNPLYQGTLIGADLISKEQSSRQVLIKPRVFGDQGGWNRTPLEVVAYRINRALKMDYVPPASYRTNLDLYIEGSHYTHAALLFFVPEFNSLSSFFKNQFPHDHDLVISDLCILALLLQNPDVHLNNVGVGKHWVNGLEHPVFIDWAASFMGPIPKGIEDCRVNSNKVKLSFARESTLNALEGLEKGQFIDLLNEGLVSESELQQILKNAKTLSRSVRNSKIKVVTLQ